MFFMVLPEKSVKKTCDCSDMCYVYVVCCFNLCGILLLLEEVQFVVNGLYLEVALILFMLSYIRLRNVKRTPLCY